MPDFGEPDIAAPAEDLRSRLKVMLPPIRPVVTYSLIVITVLVFLAQMGTKMFVGTDIPLAYGIKYNPLINEGQYWRLIAPVLLHGDILHIGFNMYALYILGRGLEPFYGHLRFFLLYLAGGFTGATASYLLTAAPSLGASTATFGLLAAYGVLGYHNKKVFGQHSTKVVQNVVQVALINLALGLTPGIDNWGHLGGAAGGFLISWFGGPALEFKIKGIELRIEDRRPFFQFLAPFVIVFGLFAVLAMQFNGRV